MRYFQIKKHLNKIYENNAFSAFMTLKFMIYTGKSSINLEYFKLIWLSLLTSSFE